MLTIDNIEKIKQYSYDVVWSCDSIRETDLHYHFVMERRNIGGKIDDVKKITICRKADTVYTIGQSWQQPTTKSIVCIWMIIVQSIAYHRIV